MFKKIKFILYKYGYIKFNNILDKIDYLKTIDFNPYRKTDIRIPTLEKDIIAYINILYEIKETKLYEEYVVVKSITNDTLIYPHISNWFSNNNHMLTDTNHVYYNFLELAKEVYILNDLAQANVSNVYLQRNAIRIRPYITNIESIIDIILEEVGTSH